MRYKSTKKFTKELSKYLDSEDVTITIYPKKWAINEKTESQGEWNGNQYTVFADVIQKAAEMGFDEGLEEFLKMLSDYDITKLNGENFYNLTLLDSRGGDINIKKIDWAEPLTEEQKEELKEYGGEDQLFQDGDWAIEDVVFDSGDIIEIKVKVNDDEHILSKEEEEIEDKHKRYPPGSAIYDAKTDRMITKEYHKNGQLKCQLESPTAWNIANTPGEHDTYVKFYYESGGLLSEGIAREGKKEGLWKEYYETGQLKLEGMLKDGKNEGVYKFYYKNGKLEKNIEFKNGEELKS